MKRARCIFVVTSVSAALLQVGTIRSGATEVLKNPPDTFVECTAGVPVTVLALCADGNGRIAAPGEKWSAGCESDDKTPRNGLVWAISQSDGLSDTYFIHYATGGIAVQWYVVEAKVGKIDKTARFVGKVSAGPFPKYQSFTSKRGEYKFVPNHLSDPTSPSVTPPAGAGDALSVAANH